MRRLLYSTVLCSLYAGSAIAATPLAAPAASDLHLAFSETGPDTLWLAKNDKDKGNKPHKGKKDKKPKKDKKDKADKKAGDHGKKDKPKKGKPEKADKRDKPKKDKNKSARVKIDRPDPARIEDRVARFTADRAETVERVLRTQAPEGRDMAKILGAAALALAAPNLNIAAAPDDEVITYRNCPPGLAKKDPPCVPPGLAKKGVTYEQWASYSDEELDELLTERREPYVTAEPVTDQDLLLLSSEQIGALYALAPAPEGHRYALIDGQPVLLSAEDHTALMRINELARIPAPDADFTVAPTAALTQSELVQLYRLPAPEDGYNYAVLNGQVVSLRDDAYETLQLIRVARAVL
ncbi:transketolase [Sulfitobacter maritimus]|uniref:transketolase n=1 Tax=Sulfitobacter maritimus TaxID=2741719 RepID=UPI001FEA99C4|nr:transketolase [Sulfitobacter maritimus]